MTILQTICVPPFTVFIPAQAYPLRNSEMVLGNTLMLSAHDARLRPSRLIMLTAPMVLRL